MTPDTRGIWKTAALMLLAALVAAAPPYLSMSLREPKVSSQVQMHAQQIKDLKISLTKLTELMQSQIVNTAQLTEQIRLHVNSHR